MKFSVVIAAWNEGAQIGSALRRLRQISQQNQLEIILVDGRSDDDTALQARDWADQVIVHDRPNRGAQLHAGAQRASGDLLFFLRADAQPPGSWQQVLEHFWLSRQAKKTAATAFSVDLGLSPSLRLASALANASARWRGLPGGDHGLCVTPQTYRESGGFPPIPILEDLVFCERLSRLGRIVILEERIRPAARRLHRTGLLRSAASHLWLGARYRLGADPEDLWKSYHHA